MLGEIDRVLRPDGSLFLEEPCGMDIKLFDFFFRWGHPVSDFSLKVMEGHLRSLAFRFTIRWTPLLTMYAIRNPG